MARIVEIPPTWRDIVAKASIQRQIPDPDNSKMDSKHISGSMLPPDHDLHRAMMAEDDELGSAVKTAILALEDDELGVIVKTAVIALENAEVLDLTFVASELRAHLTAVKEMDRAFNAAEAEQNRVFRAAQEEKNRVFRAAQEEKNRVFRAAQEESNRVCRAAQEENNRVFRAAQEEKLRAFCAAEEKKGRAYRSERFNTFIGHRAVGQVHRAFRRMPVGSSVAAIGVGAAACGLAA
ncbi:hypothetical protein B0T14DRAFT_498646 [Immersiella caudata]|uniref:Uncharacterized protein n=1 Tax=Immersiella caudata TaxID=314043 RepID=A0AA40BXY0_9PEZI|nr:hypothetical protein B0T14DRAFT_498646 [Immersiella caudata]